MSDKRIEEIKARAKVATHGEWYSGPEVAVSEILSEDIPFLLERLDALEAKCDLYAASLKKADARVAALEEGLRFIADDMDGHAIFCEAALRGARRIATALLATAEKEGT